MPTSLLRIDLSRFNDHKKTFSSYIQKHVSKKNDTTRSSFSLKQRYERLKFKDDSSQITGMMQLNKFFDVLEDIGSIHYVTDENEKVPKYSLSPDQLKYATRVIISLIPIILSASELNKNLKGLMERFKFNEIFSITLLTTQRRFGKTHLAAMLCVCCSLAFIDWTTLSFAPTLKSSARIIDIAHQICVDLNGGEERGLIEAHSKTQHLIVKNCWNTSSKLFANPGKSTIGEKENWVF